MAELGIFELFMSRFPPSQEVSRLLAETGVMLLEFLGSESSPSCAVSGEGMKCGANRHG